MSRRPRVSRGFTLIETISAIVIISLIAGVSARIVTSAADAAAKGSTLARLESEASLALERVIAEWRQIRCVPGATTWSPDITSLSSNAISWKDIAGNSRSLSLSGSTLQISGAAATNATLVDQVTSFTIEPFDQSDLPLTASAIPSIRRLRVTLTMTQGQAAITLRTKIYLRAAIAGGTW